MNLIEIIKLGLHHKITLISTIIFCAIIGGFVATRYGTAHLENSIFIDVSVQDKFQKTSAYENLEAADQITESIQGWIIDPSFQDAVNKASSTNLAILSKKQEKNNLVISFKSTDEGTSATLGEKINQQLQKRIQEYNTNSDLLIFTNDQPLQTTPKGSQMVPYIVISAAAGLFLGLILIALFHDLRKKFHSN